jgi:hypothetical protein
LWSKGVRDEVERRTSLRGILARWIARLFGRPSPPKPLTPPTSLESTRTSRGTIRSRHSVLKGTLRAPDGED